MTSQSKVKIKYTEICFMVCNRSSSYIFDRHALILHNDCFRCTYRRQRKFGIANMNLESNVKVKFT